MGAGMTLQHLEPFPDLVTFFSPQAIAGMKFISLWGASRGDMVLHFDSFL